MRDLIKATILAIVLICLLFIVPLLVAVASSLFSFLIVVAVIWCVIKVVNHQSDDPR